MKTIKALDDKPVALDPEELTPEQTKAIPTYRKLYRRILGNALAKNGDEAIEISQVGLKLMCEGDVSLEDAEFSILKRFTNENNISLTAHFHAQLIKKLRDAENEPAPDKK